MPEKFLNGEKKDFFDRDYIQLAQKAIFVPIAISVLALLVSLIFGVEMSVQFRGGTLLTYSYVGDIDTDSVANAVSTYDASLGAVRVTTGTAFASDLKTMTISFTSNSGLTADVQSGLTNALQSQYPTNNIEVGESQDVNPTSGATFFLKCIVAVLFSFVLLVIYIALRFRIISGWSAGVFALISLVIDMVMVTAAFIFFRLAIDANFIAVVLTTLGYSINNTIVVYDRIRENRKLLGVRVSYRSLVNLSVKQSVTRSLNTTITTGVAIIVVIVVAWLTGVNSIISFALPMLVGLISGFFSSLMLSGPLWVLWQEFKRS
jgi:preprotein translocase subunit SecF